jgi:ketosteroid isomerase-like protein
MTTHTPTVSASRLPAMLEKFFETKTAGDVDGTMAYFAPDMAGYIDATLGWDFDSYAALKAVFEQYMPNWAPPARSYASKILAGEQSALVHMVDTPELFGGELRVMAAVDFADGKIVRWVDYWDSSAFDTGLYDQLRTPAESFPRDLKDARVPTRADAQLVEVATALHHGFTSQDPWAASELMHTDVVLVDMALRTQVIGKIESIRYLERVLGHVPYGSASAFRRVVGGPRGGGFEWTAGPSADLVTGITALELDADGLITAVTSVYDSRQLDRARMRALVNASFATRAPLATAAME